MAEEGNKGNSVKIVLAVICLLAAGYLIAASQGWVPAFWGGTKIVPPKINDEQHKQFEEEKKQVEENPAQHPPG